MIACIQAWQRGEKIEYLSGQRDWFGVDDPAWDFCHVIYRIAPKPKEKKLRPWKPEEVPVGAIVQRKDWPPTNWTYIMGVKGWEVRTLDGFCSFTVLYEVYWHSTDGGKTWKPCGVEVEE